MRFAFYLTSWQITRFLLTGIFILCCFSILGQFTIYYLNDYPFRDFFANTFSVDNESNFPALSSALALLFCSVLLAAITYIKKLDKVRYSRHWQGLALVFFYLAIDEAGQLHERVIDPLRSYLKVSGIFFFTWVIPAAIILIIFGLTYLKFMLHLPASTRHLFIMAGAFYVGGALGIELIGGYHASQWGMNNFPYHVIATVEEALEMLGITIFIHALLEHLKAISENLCKLELILTD